MIDIVIKLFVTDFELFQNHIVNYNHTRYNTPDAFCDGPRFIYPRIKKIDNQDYIEFLFIYKEFFFYSTNLFDQEVEIEPITFVAQALPLKEKELELICKKLSRVFKCTTEMILTSSDGLQTAFLYENDRNQIDEYTYIESFEKKFIPEYKADNYDELYNLYRQYHARTFIINENFQVSKTLDKL